MAASVVLGGLAFVLFEFLYLSRPHDLNLAGISTDIMNPATGMLVLAALVFVASGVLSASTRTAFICALFVLMIGIAGALLVGMCRGPDWVFYWPWQGWPHGI